MSTELYLGVMSGTSLDGVDAVLAAFDGGDPAAAPRLLGHRHDPFEPALQATLLHLQARSDDELQRAQLASIDLARQFAATITALLADCHTPASAVCAAGVHGQTIRHRPELGYTVQLNAPALLAELCGIDIAADFRSRDIAAGGQGAPLVPAFHAMVFSGSAPRAVLNLGGIANLSGLPSTADQARGLAVTGFDCGPGNVLLDGWIRRHRGLPYDARGSWAALGQADETLLQRFLSEPFFRVAPPKSTGRDLFHEAWLDRHLAGSDLVPQDVQASLAELTARSVGEAIRIHLPQTVEVIVCGGGAANDDLMQRLQGACGGRTVLPSTAFGVAPEHVEALAFAWLARQCRHRQPANLPSVTGARGARVLGAIYPR